MVDVAPCSVVRLEGNLDPTLEGAGDDVLMRLDDVA
jgi:hypothetical protein